MSTECIPLNHSEILMTEIVFSDDSGNYPQSELFDQVSELGGYCIGNFSDGGTGFIIKVLLQDSQISALVLTAAHVFVKNFVYSKNPINFLIGSDIYKAYPLKDKLEWDDLSLRFEDPISNVKISVPDDWIICELHRVPSNTYISRLVSLEIADPSISRTNQPVELIGVPKIVDGENLNQVCPESTCDKVSLEEVRRCLNYENNLIKTTGTILHHNDLICTTCISANGMSGGPLLIKEDGYSKVIGLLHGGPASQIHFFISEITSKTTRSQEIFELFHEYYMNKLNSMTNAKDINFVKACAGVVKIIENCLNLDTVSQENVNDLLRFLYRYALKVEYISGNFLKYNLCVSFRKILTNIQRVLENY